MSSSLCLHDYQNDIRLRLMEEWRHHRSVMLQMPTGTGKTHVLAAVVRELLDENSGAVWIVAHRRELVAQIEDTLVRFGIKTDGGCVRAMSIQWLALHIGEMAERPQLVIIDEAHHAQAETYRRLWNKCPEARFLGLTATPCRMSRSGFTDLFDVLITSWSIAEFIRKGYLSAFSYVSIRPDSREQGLIDSLKKRSADGDFQVKEMNGVLNRHASIGQLYDSVEQFAHGRKGIVYAISIDHARNIAEHYSRQGIEAMPIDSRTPAAERRRMVDDFKAGRIQVLVNVDVFSEGFDCPDVEFVQLARPTLSLAKYLQQVGRGLRRAEGKKACVIIDNVGLHRLFGLPTAPLDWQAMFCGCAAGKGSIATERQHDKYAAANPNTQTAKSPENSYAGTGNTMETIVSHTELLSLLNTCDDTAPPYPIAGPHRLKTWRDPSGRLYGLEYGGKRVTPPAFVTVFDIRYDMAAVRFANNTCGLVGKDGKTIMNGCRYASMKFAAHHLLTAKTPDGSTVYTDLHNLCTYTARPLVSVCGNIELLRIGHTYYSRTLKRYANSQNISANDISDHGFYITIFDHKVPGLCHIGSDITPFSQIYTFGHACLLSNDNSNHYWLCRRLPDGSIIIADNDTKVYLASADKPKTYIGCLSTADASAECLAGIERIVRSAEHSNNTAALHPHRNIIAHHK